MVNHHWMETKLIQYERAKNLIKWNQSKEEQLRYLLHLYHTGKFYNLSETQIVSGLNRLNQRRVGR